MIYSVLWIFLIFSVLGWIVDTVSESLTNGKIVNRGLLVGPVCPMYGFLCVGAYILNTYICKDVFFVQLGIFSLMCALAIFGVNILLDKIFKIKLWNFSDTPLNYKGYISPLGAIFGGFLLAIISTHINGYICLLSSEIPSWINLIIFLLFGFLLFCDFIFSTLVMLGLKKSAKPFECVAGTLSKVENKAGRVIEEGTEKAKLGSKLYKLLHFFQNLWGRAIHLLSKIKNHFTAENSVFTKRIVKAYRSIMSTRSAEKLQIGAKEHMRLNMQEYEKSSDTDKKKHTFAYGLNYSKLFLLFVAGSVIGCIMETCFALVYVGHFEIRVGLVYGPFIPVYGLGAVLLTLALSRFYKSSFIGLFVISGAIGATFEYFCSWIQEMLFGTISWDYSDMPFNIDGRTSLAYAVVWGILGVIWVRELYPAFSRLIEKIPVKIGYLLTLILTVFMVFNVVISCAAQWRADARSQGEPAATAFERYLDKHFDDDYLNMIYPHMEKVDNE